MRWSIHVHLVYRHARFYPCTVNGYVGDDKANAETVDSEGWLKTGDLCYFSEDGFLYIADRLKELINYKGYQVPTAELERILQSHPGIADAVVIPYPEEDAGQLPMAFIVRQPGLNLTYVNWYTLSAAVTYMASKRIKPKKIEAIAGVESDMFFPALCAYL